MKKEHQELPSNRSFGLVFSAFFLLLFILRFWKTKTLSPPLGALSLGFLFSALFIPGVLTIPNRWWMKLGGLMHRIISPVIMGALYFLVVTPYGLILRATGADFMNRKFRPEDKTYWETRLERRRADRSFLKQQF